MRKRHFARIVKHVITAATILGIAIPSLSAILPHAPAAVKPQTVVSLTFDDGTADQMTVESILNASRLKGTFFVNSGTIGLPGYLTKADLSTIAAAGHEIGGHTVTHPDLTTLPLAEVQRQICDDRVQLASWGLPTPRSFAYPFAATNATIDGVAKACGYNSARNLGDVTSKACPTGCVAAETIPPANAWETRALDEYDNTWTLADLEAPVLSNVNHGGWLQYTFHTLCTTGTCDSISITPTLLTQFAQWLAARQTQAGQNIVVKTVGSVIGGTVKPLVNGPAVPPPAAGGNGVNNPSLETVSNGVPSCWWNSSYGTNSPSFALVPGHTGAVASQITMTGYSSGDAKLLPTFDLGACAPSVASGHTYSMRTWYTSTVVTQFAVYLRTTQGGWVYWTSSPWFAATSTFTQAEFTTPAIPAGYNGISFGLNIFSNGVLRTDDYALYDSVGAPPVAAADPVAPAPAVTPSVTALVPAPQASVSDPAADPAATPPATSSTPDTGSTPPATGSTPSATGSTPPATGGTPSADSGTPTPTTPPTDTSAPPAPSDPATPPAAPPAVPPATPPATVPDPTTGAPSA
jgi:peptidoglycan/xylan/chitin deacetylase (PgdA/CDA1 family)